LAAIECFLFQYNNFYIWYVINDVLTWRREINLIDNSFVGVFWLLGTQEIILKTPPIKAQQRAPKTPQRRTGKALHNLEEPRWTIYTYHEDSYKV
jgi:hypothetical protein